MPLLYLALVFVAAATLGLAICGHDVLHEFVPDHVLPAEADEAAGDGDRCFRVFSLAQLDEILVGQLVGDVGIAALDLTGPRDVRRTDDDFLGRDVQIRRDQRAQVAPEGDVIRRAVSPLSRTGLAMPARTS